MIDVKVSYLIIIVPLNILFMIVYSIVQFTDDCCSGPLICCLQREAMAVPPAAQRHAMCSRHAQSAGAAVRGLDAPLGLERCLRQKNVCPKNEYIYIYNIYGRGYTIDVI